MDTLCAGDLRINHFDTGDTIAQRRRRAGVFKYQTGPPPERRSTISSMASSYQVTRMRNLSGGSSGSAASGSSSGSGSSGVLDNQYSSTDNNHLYIMDNSPFANYSTVPEHSDDFASESHRKLDRSLSDSDNNGQISANPTRYKTELCRPFEESGSCKYGDKCQFAHGQHELRNLDRHPKYKTERCRTFHTIGFCPYGPRCHFIHEDLNGDGAPTKQSDSESSSPSLSPTLNDDQNNFSYGSSSQMNIENTQINNNLTVNINYGNVDLHSLEHQFNSALNLNRNNYNESSHYNNTSDENDIFSSISVFRAEELVDNAQPKPSSNSYLSSHSHSHHQSLDNYPGYTNTSQSCYWPSTMSSQNMAPVDPFNYSPTGSTGSSTGSSSSSGSSSSDSGSGSDFSGSTESLVVPGFHHLHHNDHYNHHMDWRRHPNSMGNCVC